MTRAAVILHVLAERERRELRMGREMKWESVHFCMSVICCCSPSAFREVIPAVHEAAAPEPEGKPPSPPRWSHAVRPLPQRHRPVSGASSAVLEVGVHKGQSGCRQGIVGSFSAMVYFSLEDNKTLMWIDFIYLFIFKPSQFLWQRTATLELFNGKDKF